MSSFITGNFSEQTLSYAIERHENTPAYNGSATDNQRRIDAFATEQTIAAAYGVDIEDTYQWDMTIDGERVDVKTTYRRAPAKPYYEVNVLARVCHNQTGADKYIFADVDGNGGVTFLGWIDRDSFIDQSVLHPAGSVKTYRNGQPLYWQEDTYSVTIASLNGFDDSERTRLLAQLSN